MIAACRSSYRFRKVISVKKSSYTRPARWLSLLLAVLMIFTVCSISVLAEGESEAAAETSADAAEAENAALAAAEELPNPPPSFYIYDEEDLLSASTKSAILTRNGNLYEKFGMQIVLLTLKKIPGTNINTKGEYLKRIIDSWQIGGISENCLVIAMSKEQQDYVAIAGDGLSAEFTVDTWSALFSEYLEPKFSIAEYDAGALAVFNAAADKAELYAAANNMGSAAEAVPTAVPEEAEKKEEKDGESGFFVKLLKGIGLVLFIILVILIVGFIVIYVHGQMVLKKRREARRRRAMQAEAQRNDRTRAAEDDIWNRY